MANNRMQIYCKKCLELQCISKYYPCEWYCQNGDNSNPMHEFLLKHSEECWKDEDFDHMTGCEMFGFRTECDDDEYFSNYKERPYKLIKKDD